MSSSPPIQIGTGIAARVAPAGGEKVLWIHGYTLDSSIWKDLWQHLSEWHHIGIDLPGHGASAPIIAGEDLAGLASRIGRLALENRISHLVGLSFGSMVALQIAMQLPHAFASLILGAPSLGGGPQDPCAQARNIELMQLYKQRGPGPWLTELWMKSPPDIFKGARAHPQLWEQLRELVNQHSWLELQSHSMHRLSNYQQSEKDLRKIRAATLLIIGENDMNAFKRCSELIRRAVPEAKRVYLSDVGHLCMLEAVSATAEYINAHFRRYSDVST